MADLAARLRAAAERDEVISPLSPERLGAATWWPGHLKWPEPLRAGLIEPRRGYRFKPENLVLPLLLPDLGLPTHPSVVDLGAGSGSLTLLAAYALPNAVVVGVERQHDQVTRLQRTIDAHGLQPRVSVLERDIQDSETVATIGTALGGKADLVVCNPPYFPPDWGRPSSNESTHLSTHALHGDVTAFLQTAASLLSPGGRVLVVFDAHRLAILLAAAGTAGLGLSHMLWIGDQRPERDNEPFRVWVTLESSGSSIVHLL